MQIRGCRGTPAHRESIEVRKRQANGMRSARCATVRATTLLAVKVQQRGNIATENGFRLAGANR